jgi:hypothetical protein
VCELVGDDEVARAHEAGDDADVGAVAGGEEEALLLVLEARHGLRELVVERGRPAQDGRAARAGAEATNRVAGGFDDIRSIGETEIVVRRQVDETAQALLVELLDDVDARSGCARHGLAEQVVALRPRLVEPIVEGPQDVEGILARPPKEVAVIEVVGRRRHRYRRRGQSLRGLGRIGRLGIGGRGNRRRPFT